MPPGDVWDVCKRPRTRFKRPSRCVSHWRIRHCWPGQEICRRASQHKGGALMSRTTKDMPPEFGLRRKIEEKRRRIRLRVRRWRGQLLSVELARMERLA